MPRGCMSQPPHLYPLPTQYAAKRVASYAEDSDSPTHRRSPAIVNDDRMTAFLYCTLFGSLSFPLYPLISCFASSRVNCSDFSYRHKLLTYLCRFYVTGLNGVSVTSPTM